MLSGIIGYLKQQKRARSETQQRHVARSEVLLRIKLENAFLAGIWQQEDRMKDRRVPVGGRNSCRAYGKTARGVSVPR